MQIEKLVAELNKLSPSSSALVALVLVFSIVLMCKVL